MILATISDFQKKMKYNYIQRILSYYYRRLGRKIAKNPLYFLIVPIVTSIILSTGMIAVKVERDADYLYSVKNGEAEKNKRAVEELFPMNLSTNCDPLRLTDRRNIIYVMVFPHDGGDILRKEYLNELISIDNYIRKLQVKWNDSVFNYSRICAKYYEECYKNPIFHYKSETKEKNQMKYPIAVDPLTYVFVPYVVNLGGVVIDNNDNVEMAKAARLLYIMDDTISDIQPFIFKWQNAFLTSMLNWQSNLISVQVYVPVSVGEEFSQFTSQLMPFVGVAALVIMIFSMVTSITNDWVRSKPWLGMSACFSAAFALGASFGVAMICGVDYVDINIALPFLILGMEVDDAYVLIAAWRRTKSDWTVEKRMEETYSEAAVSISITSLTNFLSFCVGMLTPYPVLQIFCIYASISVLFTFIYLISFFGACLALSGYRERSGIHPFTCKTITDNKSSPKEINNGDCMMVFFRDKLGMLLTFLPFRVVIISVYFTNLICGLWGLQFLSGNVEIRDVFSSDSHLITAVESHYKYFTQYPYTLHIVINKILNYADPHVQKQLDELFLRLESIPETGDERARLSWLKYYLSFQKNPFGRILLNGYDTSDKQEFIDGLSEVFLKIRLAEQFKMDIVFNYNRTEIIASRFVLLAKDLNSVKAEQKMYNYIREIADTSPFPIIAHSMLFNVFEQTSVIKSVIIQLGWMTTLLIAVLFFLFIPSVKCALCVSLAVISSMLETIGFMAMWGVKLDVLSMVTLILSAGFSINYPTHMSFSFMMDKSVHTNDRLKQCLYAVGMPVVQGTFSTILAALSLLYKRAYLMDACFKIIFLVTVNTAFHALFVIPVVLSSLEMCSHQKLQFDHRVIKKASLEEQEECLEDPELSSRTEIFALNAVNSETVYFLKT